jgi:MFS transporter, putative metabolite:H+ symporter
VHTPTVPNFVRGMVVPITMLFQLFRKELGIQQGALLVGAICLAVALLSLRRLQETFHKGLGYFEDTSDNGCAVSAIATSWRKDGAAR